VQVGPDARFPEQEDERAREFQVALAVQALAERQSSSSLQQLPAAQLAPQAAQQPLLPAW